MPFTPFNELFPELGRQETRSITVPPGADLGVPPAHYEFVEMYCDEPACDCRRVMLMVLSSASRRIEAVIAWGWESLDFYEKWLHFDDPATVRDLQGPVLNFGSPRTENSEALLALAQRLLLSDPAYVERIQRHYALFRERIGAGGGRPSMDSHKKGKRAGRRKSSDIKARWDAWKARQKLAQQRHRSGKRS